MSTREQMIAAGAIKPRERPAWGEPTPRRPLVSDKPVLALDDAGRFAAERHIRQWRSCGRSEIPITEGLDAFGVPR